MEMVVGMVDVGMEQEVRVREEAVVFVDTEEDMVVEICNKSWVVTMAMVDQGHHLPKAMVSMLITKCLISNCRREKFNIHVQVTIGIGLF